MDDFINGMVEKVGIDKETADKVVEYIKENASSLPALLGKVPGLDDIKDKLGMGSGPGLGSLIK